MWVFEMTHATRRQLPPCSLTSFTCRILDAFLLRIMLLFLFPDYLLSFCVANAKDSPTAKQMNETFTQQVSYARRKQQRLASKLHKMTVPEWSDRLRGSCWAHNVTFIITIPPNHKHVITKWSKVIIMLWSKRRRLLLLIVLIFWRYTMECSTNENFLVRKA